jgi:methionyl-tRNA synthetase
VQTELDVELQTAIRDAVAQVTRDAERLDFSMALRGVWDLIARVNKYVVVREPWALAKSPANRQLLETTLYHAADALGIVGRLIEPVMPETATKIRGLFEAPDRTWQALEPGRLASGRPIGRIDQLFPRIELTVDELRAAATGGRTDRSAHVSEQQPPTPPAAPAAAPASAPAPAAAAPAPATERITIDDFLKIDLRTAKVLAAEKVPNSRKLMKLSIDVGTEQRTLVAGIAEAYEPEQLVGRTVGIVFNLKPAKLMGIESTG